MTSSFGWCLDGKHVLPAVSTHAAHMNEGRCPGKSHNGELTCGCWCHKTVSTNG